MKKLELYLGICFFFIGQINLYSSLGSSVIIREKYELFYETLVTQAQAKINQGIPEPKIKESLAQTILNKYPNIWQAQKGQQQQKFIDLVENNRGDVQGLIYDATNEAISRAYQQAQD